jgi:hypothetical protein
MVSSRLLGLAIYISERCTDSDMGRRRRVWQTSVSVVGVVDGVLDDGRWGSQGHVDVSRPCQRRSSLLSSFVFESTTLGHGNWAKVLLRSRWNGDGR